MYLDKLFRTRHLKEIIKLNGKTITSAKQINGGFYGYAFLVETAEASHKYIAKVYKQEGYVDAEFAQLNMLRKYALIHVPEIFGVSYKKDNGYFDVLFMEFINGVSACDLKMTNAYEKERFANDVVDNILAIHEASSENGFGDFVTGNYCNSWEEYYYNMVSEYHAALHNPKIKKISVQTLEIADRLYDDFDKVFSMPVKQNSLIHGDYNLWNLMGDPNTNKLTAMLDPMGSSFADRELELFQLQNANASEYGLLENYKSKCPLSDNFDAKNAYYYFWNDIMHFLKSGYCDNKRFTRLGSQALDLI